MNHKRSAHLVFTAIAALISLTLINGCVTQSAALKAGEKAYYTKDYSTAYEQFRKAAGEEGNPEAQWWLSMMYAEGNGTAKDPAESLKWERLSAENGFATAQTGMGLRYMAGTGVEKDPRKAADWFKKAADQGNGMALVSLAFMTARGQGVEKDPDKALKYFQDAKKRGHNVPEKYLTADGVAGIKP